MANSGKPTVYLRFRKRIMLSEHRPVHLGEVAHVLSEDGDEERLRAIVVKDPAKNEGNLILIDMMMVVRALRNVKPEAGIELFGPPHALVEISPKAGKPPNYALVGLVWLLLFIGSGLAIMNFHADVSMLEVHRRIYELLTGRKAAHPYILQIPYSIGLGAGMVLFFNHLFKKKFNEEPSPLEVEMYLYQENVNQVVIHDEYAKMAARKGGGRE